MWADDVDTPAMVNSFSNNEDSFALSLNNASRHTTSTQSNTDNSGENDNNNSGGGNNTNNDSNNSGGSGGNTPVVPVTNTNRNNLVRVLSPGESTPSPEGELDSSIPIPTIQKITAPDFDLGTANNLDNTKPKWPTTMPYYFMSLLLLVALYYTYLAIRDYRQAKIAEVLLSPSICCWLATKSCSCLMSCLRCSANCFCLSITKLVIAIAMTDKISSNKMLAILKEAIW